MTSQHDIPVTVTSVILASPADWDEWIEITKSKAMIGGAWKYVNPYTRREDLPVPEKPTRPSPSTVNPNKSKFSELDEDEKYELDIQRADYKMNYRQYEELQLAIDGLRVQIQGTISRTYLVYTFRCDTTYDMLASLKQRVAPSDYTRKLQLTAQYARLRKGPKSQKYEAWLQEWEKVILSARH